MNRQSREILWAKRRYDSIGGDAALGVTNTMAIGSMCLMMGIYKNGGFHFWPLSVKKTPMYAGIVLAGFIGGSIGGSAASSLLGDS